MNFFKAVDQSDSRVKFQQLSGVETQSDVGVQLVVRHSSGVPKPSGENMQNFFFFFLAGCWMHGALIQHRTGSRAWKQNKTYSLRSK